MGQANRGLTPLGYRIAETTIAAGLNDVMMDYLVDAIDHGGTTESMLRGGASKAISPGSWRVNCTGYVFGATPPPRAPAPASLSRRSARTIQCSLRPSDRME